MKKNTKSVLFVGAIGVVYGDIGTSPLYALKSCFALGGLAVTPLNVIGIISLFLWILMAVVTLKYVNFVMTFNNNGEGGILALSSLIAKVDPSKNWSLSLLVGIIGASLFFGDAIITPAISVLGALEGVGLVAPAMIPYIPTVAFIVLTLLFSMQKYGSGLLGHYFGPIMILWFVVIGLLGFVGIVQNPRILLAFNPYYALHFFYENGWMGLMVFGGTILVVTGAEALYADLGHFGQRIIQISWTYCVFPSLFLNYLGQGGLLLAHPEALQNPFYLLAPPILLYPLIGLSTIATIIAAQAVISGVFSVCWQGIMLNIIPRMHVIHTSFQQIGQIYIPIMNFLVYLLTTMAVWYFQTSDNMAAAYGVSVSGVMFITTLLLYILTSQKLKWGWGRLAIVFIPLFLLDTSFVLINLFKIFEGGWYTILISLLVIYVVWIWHQGNMALQGQKINYRVSLKNQVIDYDKLIPQKIPGTAIFLTRTNKNPPHSLMIHLKHNKFMYEKTLFVTIDVTNTPRVTKMKRFTVEAINDHAFILVARFGFKEIPDLHKVIQWATEQKILDSSEDITLYLTKGQAVPSKSKKLFGLGEKLYVFLARNALSAHEFYKIPDHAVVEFNVRYRI